jgi:hypothetical protein
MECMYCTENESEHFCCEKCGGGMCDRCYNLDVPHDIHYHLPLENCDSEIEIKLVTEACGNDDPAYVCENCMNEIMTSGLIKYIKETIEKLILHKRFTISELSELLQKEYGIDGELIEVDKSGLVSDYAFITPITKYTGYIDIYYLKIPFGEKNIYITEVNVFDE